MLPRVCRHQFVRKARVAFAAAEKAPARHHTLSLVAAPSRLDRSQNHRHREFGTSASGSEGAEGRGNAEGVRNTAGSAAPGQYELPAPTWSLSDLNVTTDDEVALETARAALGPGEVAKLCALAHIELSSVDGGGSGSGSGGNLDVAAVQRDVGAMLRCMQTMRREREGEEERSDGEQRGTVEVRGREGEDRDEESGPWGGAVPWAAPLQEDMVSDGAIQEKVLGAAQRTEDGFFTAPRVVEK